MNILVTGANGMLGSTIANSFQEFNLLCTTHNELDIAKWDSVKKMVEDFKPSVIVHTAAYTNVDECEINKEKCYNVNVLGTQNLVDASITLANITFVYISSTGVYGVGKLKEPYIESDQVKPTTIHHKTKYEAEKIIAKYFKKYI